MNKIRTKIRSAKIFRHGAEVVRGGKAELGEGRQTVMLLGLSTGTDLDTVRLFCAEGVRCAGIRFLSNEAESDHDQGAENKEGLQDELLKLQEKIDALKKQVGVKELQISLWQKNGDFTHRAEQSASEMEAYISLLPERIAALQQEILACTKEMKTLEKEKAELEKRRHLPVMIAELIAEHAGEYPVELHYHENAASWRGLNELHTDCSGDLELRLRAKIIQNTDEEWKNISVSLYTGNPSVGNVLPVLNPVFVQYREPVKLMAKAAPAPRMGGFMMGAAASESGYAMEDSVSFGNTEELAPSVRLQTEEAESRSGETMTEYVLAGLKTIRPGSDGITEDLQTFTISAEYRITAVPKADSDAYLTAKIASSDLPAAALSASSEVDVYLKGMYAGRTYLSLDSAEEFTEIPLGREEHIKLSRKETGRKTSSSMLKGQTITQYSYEITASSRSEKAVKLFVKDQIPVSRDKSIQVELVSAPGASRDEESGILSWELSVPAGGTSTASFSYKISYPKDKKIEEVREYASGSDGNGTVRFCPVCGSPVHGAYCPNCGSRV